MEGSQELVDWINKPHPTAPSDPLEYKTSESRDCVQFILGFPIVPGTVCDRLYQIIHM